MKYCGLQESSVTVALDARDAQAAWVKVPFTVSLIIKAASTGQGIWNFLQITWKYILLWLSSSYLTEFFFLKKCFLKKNHYVPQSERTSYRAGTDHWCTPSILEVKRNIALISQGWMGSTQHKTQQPSSCRLYKGPALLRACSHFSPNTHQEMCLLT